MDHSDEPGRVEDEVFAGPASGPAPRARARHRWVVAGTAAVLAGAVVAGVVAGLGDPASGDLLGAVVDRAERAGTARFEMTTHQSGLSEPAKSTGEVDFARDAVRMTMAPEFTFGGVEIRMVGGAAYMAMPRFGGHAVDLPPDLVAAMGGPRWVRTVLPEGAAFAARPDELLDGLRAVGAEPRRLGREDVRGVPTTAYRVDDLAVRTVAWSTVTVYVDDDGLPRRLVVDAAPKGAEAVRMTVELFDFGARIEPITAPPTAETVDAADLSRR